MGEIKWLIVAALVILLAAHFGTARATEICGVDVTQYQPIDKTRWRTADETLVAERVIFGYPPNHAFYMIMSFHVEHRIESVVKYVSSPNIVTDVITCKEQPEDKYNASHEADVATIDQENTTRLPWHPGD